MISMWGPRARRWQVRPCEWTQPSGSTEQGSRWAVGRVGGKVGCWHLTGQRERQRLFSVLSAPQGRKDQSVICPAPLTWVTWVTWGQGSGNSVCCRRVGPTRVCTRGMLCPPCSQAPGSGDRFSEYRGLYGLTSLWGPGPGQLNVEGIVCVGDSSAQLVCPGPSESGVVCWGLGSCPILSGLCFCPRVSMSPGGWCQIPCP